MRIVGIDFGERRIGVAAADDRTRLAIPVTTIVVRGDPIEDLVGIVEEQRAEEIVFGLPLSLTGAEGPQAQRIREVATALEARIDIPIRFQDERLTTRQADHATPRKEEERLAGEGGQPRPRRRRRVDRAAGLPRRPAPV